MVPYSRRDLDMLPLQAALNAAAAKDLSPEDSCLRHTDVRVYYKFAQPAKLQACNVHSHPAPAPACLCQQGRFIQYAVPQLGHVMTADLNILQHSPELKQFLEKGTSYKQKFCDDDRALKEICDDLVHEVADRAADKDNLNQAMYGEWVRSVNATLGLELDQLEARRAACAEGGELLVDPTPDLDPSFLALVTKQLEAFSSNFTVTVADKANGAYAFICTAYVEEQLHELILSSTYTEMAETADAVADRILGFLRRTTFHRTC